MLRKPTNGYRTTALDRRCSGQSRRYVCSARARSFKRESVYFPGERTIFLMTRTIRVPRDMPRMATITTVPKKQTDDEVQESRVGQGRPTLHRYRLQVDRQTKSSFENRDAAEKAGKAIKKAHPVVQVTIYDAEGEDRITIEAV